MLVSDLDGTLLDSRGRLREEERETLQALGERGVLRVVATGRNLYSARRVMAADFPVDYLVFASGAGIMHWPSQALLTRFALAGEEVRAACDCLRALRLDFMLHREVPDNHFFHWLAHGRPNPDFERRMARYADYALDWHEGCELAHPASQFVVVEPEHSDGEALHARLRAALPGLHVVRTTSPLDGRSTWVEIFPPSVSKSSASAWLAARHGTSAEGVLAVGNDWNDSDLLAWAGVSRVVANAVAGLREQHRAVASNDHGGVSEAVREWLGGEPDPALQN